MIKLNIDKHCDNCPEFEAEVDKSSMYNYSNNFDDHIEAICTTIITCKHKDRCRGMVTLLKGENNA